MTATGQKYVYDFQQDPFLKIARRKDERIEAEHFCGADEFRRCQELWARKGERGKKRGKGSILMSEMTPFPFSLPAINGEGSPLPHNGDVLEKFVKNEF